MLLKREEKQYACLSVIIVHSGTLLEFRFFECHLVTLVIEVPHRIALLRVTAAITVCRRLPSYCMDGLRALARTNNILCHCMLKASRFTILSADMVRFKKGGFCLAVTLSTRSALAMVSFSRRGSRYFAVQQTLPPLSRHMSSFANQTETIPYSSHHGKSLPVMYTNNPLRISEWLSDNIPSSNGILGFDVEVSTLGCCFY